MSQNTAIFNQITNNTPNISTDIEECQTEIDNCHADANCTNTKGSFDCKCFTGYSGDGVTCVGKWRPLVTLI